MMRESRSPQQARGPAAEITGAVKSWPGVEVSPHRFGGVKFKVRSREVGHLHGARIADLPFPRRFRGELIANGRARPHHVLPDSGWVTVGLDGPDSTERAIELFRLSSERALRTQRSRPGTCSESKGVG